MKFAPGILELPCDVLIPAALETQIHSGNAGNIKVSVVKNSVSSLVTIIVYFLWFVDVAFLTCRDVLANPK